MDEFGSKFKIKIRGESHSPELGVLIDGVPEGISLCEDDFLHDISRRAAGAKGTTARKEADCPEIRSGVKNGITTSETIEIVFQNNDTRPSDYLRFRSIPRPGHADFVSSVKYREGNAFSGGGQFSGRMTLPIVAAGVVAKKLIAPIRISARLVEAGGVRIDDSPYDNPVFAEKLEEALREGDSLGGVVECLCENVPIGLGEPFFNSMESQLSHFLFSIPGVRGVEFGDGFAAAAMKGSQHNDPITDNEGHTAKNGAGGINGGISNGNPILFRVAVKPASSISKPQSSFNFDTQCVEEFSIKGRHDTCFALRTPVIVEAAAAICISDFYL